MKTKLCNFICAVMIAGNSLNIVYAQQGVGININGSNPDSSAILDVSSNAKGMLIPRLSTAERNAIASPATGLFIYNTDCNTFNYYNGSSWLPMNIGNPLATPGSISGNTVPCQGSSGNTYSVSPVNYATTYTWVVPAGAVVSGGQGSTTATITFGTTDGEICVTAGNDCRSGNSSCLAVSLSLPATAPVANAATSVTLTGFTANWDPVSGSLSYRLDVSTDNGFGSFVTGYNDLNVGTNTDYNVTGLTCNTTYFYRVRAVNSCGAGASSNIISAATLGAPAATVATAGSGATLTQITANWNSASGADHYHLDVSTDPAYASFVAGYNDFDAGNNTSANVTGLTCGLTYYYRVRAANSCGAAANSNDITYATLLCCSNTWSAKTNFGGTGRGYPVGFAIGTKGYIGTGNDGSWRKDFWEYDPGTNTWTQKADFGGSGRGQAAGFAIGTKGYIGTGNDGSWRKDFWEYDPGTNTWTQKADFGGSGRGQAAGFAIGTKGYIGTGNDGSWRKDFWEYDPGTNTWTQKADFGGSGRGQAVGIATATKGYIGTGNDGSWRKDFWEYDPGTNSWTQKTDFGGSGRGQAAGFAFGGKAYIGTGNDGSWRKDFWEYNPAADSWQQKADFPGSGRGQAVGFSNGAKGYLGTGNDGSWKNDFYEYCQ